MAAFIITIIAFFGVAIINVFTYVGVDISAMFPILRWTFLVVFIMTAILFLKKRDVAGALEIALI